MTKPVFTARGNSISDRADAWAEVRSYHGTDRRLLNLAINRVLGLPDDATYDEYGPAVHTDGRSADELAAAYFDAYSEIDEVKANRADALKEATR